MEAGNSLMIDECLDILETAMQLCIIFACTGSDAKLMGYVWM